MKSNKQIKRKVYGVYEDNEEFFCVEKYKLMERYRIWKALVMDQGPLLAKISCRLFFEGRILEACRDSDSAATKGKSIHARVDADCTKFGSPASALPSQIV
jgi:hypothetical protein